MRCHSPHEFATGPRILHAEHDVRAIVGLGSITQHRRLDIVEIHGDGAARKLAAKAINELHGLLLTGNRDESHGNSLAG